MYFAGITRNLLFDFHVSHLTLKLLILWSGMHFFTQSSVA